MEKNLISIIIPLYNRKETIIRCIDSVKNQTYNNFECLIIDDGSTDESYSKCYNYIKNDKRFMIIHQENKGVGVARNVGITKCKGDYIMFLDSDDTIDKLMIETLLNILIKRNCDIIFCNYNFIINNNIIKNKNNTEGFFSKDEICSQIENLVGNATANNIGTKIYKTKIIKNNHILFSQFQICEDILFCLNCLYLSDSIYITNHFFYNYFIEQADSLMKNYKKNCLQANLLLYKSILDLYEKYKCKETYKVFINSYIVELIIFILYNEVSQKYKIFRNNCKNINKNFNFKNYKSLKLKKRIFCIFLKSRCYLILYLILKIKQKSSLKKSYNI